MLFEKELGRASYALHACVGRPSNILLAGDDAQKEAYLYPSVRGERLDCLALTEPAAGSDLRGMRTRAVRDGDGWRVRGTKHFISHAAESDFVILFARTDDAGPDAAKAIVDVPGRPRHPGRDGARGLPNVSHRGYTNAILDFDDVALPAGALLGEEGRGLDLAGTWLAAPVSRWPPPAWAGPSARSTSPYAMPRSASSSARRSAASRASPSSWPTWRPSSSRRAADPAAAWRYDEGTATDSDIAMAKLKASEMLAFVADEAIQVTAGWA